LEGRTSASTFGRSPANSAAAELTVGRIAVVEGKERKIDTMMKRGLITIRQREYLKSGEAYLALLKTAADLEMLFWDKLFFEKQLDPKLISNWTLGKYLHWNKVSGLVDSKWYPLLEKFNQVRNQFVHSRTAMDRVKQDEEMLKELNGLILSVCDFIDQTEVIYPPGPIDMTREQLYVKHHMEQDEKLRKLLKEKTLIQ